MTESGETVEKGRKGGGERVSAAVLAERVELVLSLIVQGATRHEVWRFVSGKTTDRQGVAKGPPGGPWDVSLRTIERYFARAAKILAAEGAISRAESIALARRRYRHIMAKALAAGEHGVAERCVRSIARLDGLDAPTFVAVQAEHIHSGTVTHDHTLTVRASTIEERADGIASIFRTAHERRAKGLPAGAPISTEGAA
jgi:hypothetical protein